MDYYTVVGMVAGAFILIGGFYFTVSKNTKDEMKEREKDRETSQELNENIKILNVNFQNMLEQDKIRDKRIENHGKEIDNLREQQRMNEKVLDRHELRISNLEERNERS